MTARLLQGGTFGKDGQGPFGAIAALLTAIEAGLPGP